jgi:tRNA modification GTPase
MVDTIYALSSGGLPSGVAIIRISGPNSRIVVEKICAKFRFGTAIGLSDIVDPEKGQVIDKGLILTFVGPQSFTGEDVVELHVHGGRAVVDAIFSVFSCFEELRQAEPGEFTYRAFENGKIDLTQAEGLADLIASESEAQRIQALTAVSGEARILLESWLKELISMRALIEAEIDFVDEGDIPGSVSDQVWSSVGEIVREIDGHLSSVNRSEIIRNGFRVTLLGKPNAGKSTLLNRLAGRDLAIVTDIPGTTRDLLEVRLNLGGQVVIVTDTAGIQASEDIVEKEGIKRALLSAEQSNMTIWLSASGDELSSEDILISPDLLVMSKGDLITKRTNGKKIDQYDFVLSSRTDDGIDHLISLVSMAANKSVSGSETVLFSRTRQFDCLKLAVNALRSAVEEYGSPLELRAENLRIASDAIGKLVGRVDVEDILGVIFSEFCVGK